MYLRRLRRVGVQNLSAVFAMMIAAGFIGAASAQAMELNWSGQFWSEYHWVNNYAADSSATAYDAVRGDTATAGGYYIPYGGKSSASYQTLFLRLRPQLVVNDNIYIKSEFWLGDPVFGIFGNSVPFTDDQRQFYSRQSRGSTISAQRFWGDFITDFGTLQIGRVPLGWGLGIVWNSGEDLWSRYVSTSDGIRLISKFGNFTFTPSFIHYSAGNAVGGLCTVTGSTCTPGGGNGGVSEYSVILKYENLEEDFEGGLNFLRRLASNANVGFNQSPPDGAPDGMNFNIWDIYARKKVGSFKLGGEVPITSGDVGGLPYSTLAFAADIGWEMSDSWELGLRAGHAPGQPNSGSANLDRFKAFFFNPNYKLGTILFNYQLANFAGVNGPQTVNDPAAQDSSLASPYDNPIVNADYLGLNGVLKTQKWSFNLGLLYARAPKVAKAGEHFYNTWTRSMSAVPAIKDQGHSLGYEVDTGAQFQWDDAFIFRLDLGLFLPGEFYAFSNSTAGDNQTDPIFASVARIGVNF